MLELATMIFVNAANALLSLRPWPSSTVVFVLDPDQIPAIIKNMQERTCRRWLHLIVCAMDTEEHPVPCLSHLRLKRESWKLL